MAENNTANQEVVEQEVVESTPTESPASKEDKFFGVKTVIGKSKNPDESQDDLQVEVVDDRPVEDRKPPKAKTSEDNSVEEELEGINDKVQKRIDKLRYEYHEERRAKESSEKLRDEAVSYAQKIQNENKRLAALINKGEEALLGQISAKASAELEKAEAEFKDAYEAGDSEKMLAANKKILKSQVDLNSASERLNYYKQQQEHAKVQQQQAVQQPVQQQNLNIPEQPIDPKGAKWLQENTWFGNKDYPEATGYAMGIHEKLVKVENIHPSSDEYYEEVNKRMRQRFPELFGVEEQAVSNDEDVVVETEIPKKPSSVVAPATRNNGAMPRKVQLTATQVALARRLGLTPEQYAKQLAKENR